MESNQIEIELIDKPDAYIADGDGNIFQFDETIYLCNDINFTFRANLTELDPKESLYFTDGKDTIAYNGEPITVTNEGEYFYVFSNEDCIDTSAKITLIKTEFELSSDKDELKYSLLFGQNYEDKSIIVENKSS